MTPVVSVITLEKQHQTIITLVTSVMVYPIFSVITLGNGLYHIEYHHIRKITPNNYA